MFRFITTVFSLVFAATVLGAPAVAATESPKAADVEILDVMLNGTSRNFLPTVTEPNDLNACFCISQSIHCASILAASSGTCTANTDRNRQTDPCILRCARYCLRNAPSSGLCISIKDFLEKKTHEIFRDQFFPSAGTA